MTVVILRSDRSKVFISKVWGPILWVAASLLLFGREFPGWRFLLVSPFLIAALFEASLAIVEVRDGVVRYRRLFKWTIVPEGDIVSARVVWHPFIASMRLKRFLFPWGRLYFILDGELNPFRKGEYDLLRYVRKEPIIEDQDAEKWNSQKARAAKLKLVAAAVAGAFFYLVSQLFLSWRFSRFEPPQPVHSPGPVAIEIMWQISQVLTSFEVLCIGSAVFTLLAIYKYRRPGAWIYAFMAGTVLPRILLHWL